MKIGTKEVSKILVGTKQVDRIYIGTKLAYSGYSRGLTYLYDSSNRTYQVTGIGTCTSTNIKIPKIHDDGVHGRASVTSIGDYAFENCSSLTSVVIPNSVTSIGWYAFFGCSSLKSVVIGNSVTRIDKGAFRNCSSLTSIVIPNSVTSIGGDVFTNCPIENAIIPTVVIPYISKINLKVVVINGGNIIGDYAFENCSSLTSVVIPNSVTSIGERAFWECEKLVHVIFGENSQLKSIYNYTFYRCESMIDIVIPNSVTSIGSSVFSGCSSLTIFCEAVEKPSGWDAAWNYTNCPVVWGYTGK